MSHWFCTNQSRPAICWRNFIHRYPRLLILTGAGVSTDSDIPDYRDGEGAWKRKQPVQHRDFMESYETRQRYWGRSLIGWPMMRNATPNPSLRIRTWISRGFVWQIAPQCSGILKPDVVFFGDYVPKQRVHSALDALKASDGLLVIGSSLMVYSGFRFCRYAKEFGKPIATLNLGRTRAEELADLKLNARIGETLKVSLDQL